MLRAVQSIMTKLKFSFLVPYLFMNLFPLRGSTFYRHVIEVESLIFFSIVNRCK